MEDNNSSKIKTNFKILIPIDNNESLKEEIKKCLREIQDVPELKIERLEFEVEFNKTYVSYV